MRLLNIILALVALLALSTAPLSAQVTFGPSDKEGEPFRRQTWLVPSPDTGIAARALLFRPAGSGPFRLAVVAHASTQNALRRAQMPQPEYRPLAAFLVARGFAVLVPERLGHGATGGRYVEIETLISRAAEELVARAAAQDIAILSNMVAIARLPEHLKGLAALCGAGQVTPPAIEVMPLGEVAAAHRRVEGQHVRGKIILEVADHDDW